MSGVLSLANQTRAAIVGLFGSMSAASFVTHTSPEWEKYAILAVFAVSALWLVMLFATFLTNGASVPADEVVEPRSNIQVLPSKSSGRDGDCE